MKNKFVLKIAEYIITALLRLIFFTCKKTFKGAPPSEPFILLFWHDRLAFMPFLRQDFIQKTCKKDFYVVISQHGDGELITRIISHFGIKAVRGSSKKGAVSAMISALKVLKNGDNLVITPDGPRGPRHSISDGCVSIPQKTGAKLVAVSYSSSSSWYFKSWDKMELPKPFSKVEFMIGEAFSVDGLDPHAAKEKIAQEFAKIKSF